jgi:hypothetical protein
MYKNYGINFSSISHLDSLGLLQFNEMADFQYLKIPKKLIAFYFGRHVELTFPKDTENTLKLGKVLLTQAGKELASVCKPEPVEGFFDYVYDRWEKESLVPKK